MRIVISLLVALVVLTLGASPAIGQAGLDTDLRAALADARALPGDTRLRLVGDVGNEHERTPFALEFDARGRFVSDYTRTKMKDTGFDGRTALGRDAAGYVHEVHGWNRDTQLFIHGLIAGNWTGDLAPWLLETVDDDDTSTLVLRATAEGRHFEGRVLVDRESMLPERATWETFGVDYTIEFRSWSESEVGVFPEELGFGSRGKIYAEFRFTSLEAVGDVDVYTLEDESNEDAEFLGGVPSELEMRALPSGHMFVRVSVNGNEPGWFGFDTGAAGTFVDHRVAREAGLDLLFDDLTATGAAGSAGIRMWRARELGIGPLRLRRPVIGSADLRGLGKAFGFRLDGVLGADVLAHGVWLYDIAASEAALYPPNGLDPEDAHWIPTRRSQGHLLVHAGFEGHQGWFTLDTGGGGPGVTFHQPTTERLALLDGRKTALRTMTGLGGSTRQRSGVIETFTFAGKTWRNVAADFPEAVGTWRDPYVDGLFGIRFLRPYRVVFDYPGCRIGLIKR